MAHSTSLDQIDKPTIFSLSLPPQWPYLNILTTFPSYSVFAIYFTTSLSGTTPIISLGISQAKEFFPLKLVNLGNYQRKSKFSRENFAALSVYQCSEGNFIDLLKLKFRKSCSFNIIGVVL